MVTPNVSSQSQPLIVSITDFRRNAGAYLDNPSLNPITIVRDSRVVGYFIPVKKGDLMTTEEKLKKFKKLSGGFHFGRNLTADQMNKDYDKMYDQMLPR